MLELLLNPMIRKIIIGVATAVSCMLAYSIWAAHMRHIGAENEKQREESIAIEHQNEVTSKANEVDQEVAKDANPQEKLQKEWMQK